MILCPNQVFIRLWRLITGALILWAQWIRFPENNYWRHFVYYTNQTNLMALLICLWMLCAAILPSRKTPPPWLHAGVSFYLLTTMLVYWFVLFQSSSLSFGKLTPTLFAGYVLHALSPVLIFLDWVFFVPHGNLEIRHAFGWMVYPFTYCFWIFLRAEIGPRLSESSRYPYPFMDKDLLTLGRIISYGITFFAGFLLLALLYVGLDRCLVTGHRDHIAKTPCPDTGHRTVF